MLAAVALCLATLAAVGSPPAGATQVVGETAFRNAWTTDTNETLIELGDNITLTCGMGGLAQRNSNLATPLVLDGHGFTITQTCANNGVLRAIGTQPIVLQNVTITGGDTGFVGGGMNTTSAALTINNALFIGNEAPGAGGAISGDGGALTINDSVIVGNTVNGFGAVSSDTSITLNRSRVSGNTNTNAGGTAAFGTDGVLTMTDSIVQGNFQPNGGAVIGTGGGVQMTRSSVIDNEGFAIGTDGPIVLVDSTVARNDEGGTGNGSTVSLTNSTVADNGGVGISSGQAVTLVYATVTGNGGGTGDPNIEADGGLVSFGSVVAQPDGGDNCDVPGTITSGYNFSDDDTCDFLDATDTEGAGNDPHLGALANNGGPTETRLPLTGSPLIDAIPTASCQADGAAGVTTDQRLLPRPAFGGCDIGSVEVQPPEEQGQEIVELTPTLAG
jgi:predicted outer membrane repeat protein